jgi:hypothetical protein
MSMSRVVFDAAEAGDAKAALEFLRHKCDWTAAQRIQVDVGVQCGHLGSLIEGSGNGTRATGAIRRGILQTKAGSRSRRKQRKSG